jgi:N-acetyl sugar amidotransferase
MRYCVCCITPDTRPNIVLDAAGICNACRSHEERPLVDWAARRRSFGAVVDRARALGHGYDCLVPVSGGKDSTWQVVTCLEHGLTPLAVTWRPPGRTELGQANLDNLISLGVDHIDYSISPRVERAFTLAALERMGLPALPMHMALFNIPLTIAVRFQIPLVVWGENSAVEYGTSDDQYLGARLDREWLAHFGVTAGTTAQDWVSDELSARSLAAYFGPSDEELEAAGVHAIFLGHYFPWDPERSLETASAHGFRAAERPRIGYYDYADIDDAFIAVHHYFKWPKFGFTRSFDNLSLEIRNGRIGRDQAIVELRRLGDETPHGDIDEFCAFLGIGRGRFDLIVERFRNHEIWQRREDGVWTIPGFIVPDWEWTT